jgi:hypothetical protein
MIGKKINELATELAPLSTDLTIIGDPTTGVSKKITLEQISSLFGGSVSFYTNLAGFPAVGNIDIIYCAKNTNKLYLWSGSAYVEMFPSQALLDTYQLRSEKGNANGYASLDSLGKVPISQLPSSLMEYLGTWNAATNTPTLANGTGDNGDVYLCNVAGTVNFGAGPITFSVGDWVIYNGTIWERSSGSVGTVTSVAVSRSGDALAITGSPVTTSGTINIGFAGTSGEYINGAGNRITFPTLLSSVGLSMPSAFNVANSPLTANGTIAVTGAGNATQYVRGDGQLATLPTNGGGGGASVSYYLNGSINQGTIGGVTYYEMNKTPIIGAGTDFTTSSNGYIASFLTDANDPALLNIPAGNFNFETYFEASSGGGSPTFYIELYKYDGTTFTLIASNSTSPKLINDGTNIEAYFSALAVPQTTLTLTDRLAIRIYVTTAGRTITLHTENGHLCQVITTFTTGLTALNGLTSQVQYLATGTSGSDFNISSASATHTFNLPTASATNRGALASADWTTFNNKQNALNGTGFVKISGTTISYDNSTYYLASNPNAYIPLTALSAGAGISYNNTTGVIASTITQYTDANARAAISETVTGLDYNNTTGVLSLTSGYVIPTTTNETNWNAAYNDKINSASVTGTTTKTLTLTQQDGGTITASWTDDNTDAVTSVFGRTGAVVATSGDYTTAQVTESGNLYFTNARAIASTLTGYTSGAGTITSSDSILSAIQKLNGNIGALTTGVSSVNGLTGAVTLTTSNIAEGTNLYYTEARVNANTNVAANTAARHNAVTIGTANGLSLSTQVLSLGLASTSTTGALSSTDWNTFNNKTSNTGTVTSVGLSSATSGVTIGSTPITTSGTITLAIATASGSQQGLLSSTDWTTFNNKQNALTNPVTGTGTTNYLPKFTGASTIGDSAIFDNSGNILIGATSNSEGAKLKIAGGYVYLKETGGADVYFRSAYDTNKAAIQVASANDLVFVTSNTTRLTITSSGAASFSNTVTAGGGTAVLGQISLGISTANTTNSKIAVYDNTGSNFWGIGLTSYSSVFGLGLFSGTTATGTPQVVVNSNGNVGINTTAPTERLEVNGSVRITGAITSNTTGAVLSYEGSSGSLLGAWGANSSTSGFLRFYLSNSTGTTGNEYMRLTTTGLGIGTTSPSAKLHVVGDGIFSSSSNTALTVSSSGGVALINLTTGAGNQAIYGGVGGSNVMDFYTNSAFKMRLDVSGNLGLGTSTPNERLSLVGSTATTFGLSLEPSGWNGAKHRFTVPTSGDTSMLSFNYNGSVVDSSLYATSAIYLTQGVLAFSTGATNAAPTERMRITSGGNVEINTGSIKTGEPDTGWGRAAIKIGAKVSGEAFNVDYYLPVSVDGTVYYINLNSSTP